MKKLSMMVAVLALVATACDPYEDEPGGEPQILTVSVPYVDEATEPTDGWWVLTDVPSEEVAVFVTTNQLLDGETIQTAPQDPSDPTSTGDCTPANNWITITKDDVAVPLTGDAGENWYTCYYPSAATANYGSSVLIFRSATPPGFTAASSPLATGTLDAGATYEFTGSVETVGGDLLPIQVRIVTAAAAPAP